MKGAQLAVVCDYPQEGWPSMDLCAEMLVARAGVSARQPFQVKALCPAFRRRWQWLPLARRRGVAFQLDRLCNRFGDYPRWLRGQARAFDCFHVVDHSYAHLIHALPPYRAGVYCHDLDAFRCLLEPRRDPRPRWFRALVRHVLRGLQRAALVFFSTREVRRQIESFGLIDPCRLVHAPYGAAPEYSPDPGPATADGRPLSQPPGERFVLHVGSCVPRKRIDVLLALFAALRGRQPELRLVQVGGQWTADQQELLGRLGIGPHVLQVRGLTRTAVAELYRRAALVVQPSEAEGFGLPVLEALACGAPVLASDLPSLREVGGSAATYCPVADLPTWSATADRLLAHPESGPGRTDRLAQAGRFSWAAHAGTICAAYQSLLTTPCHGPR
jgi:glycosyltransferase involved in cell wall biosynthesis